MMASGTRVLVGQRQPRLARKHQESNNSWEGSGCGVGE